VSPVNIWRIIKMKKVLLGLGKFIYFFTGFYVILTMNVHAYIDPSAVTYGIQAIAAVVVAIGALIAVFRHKIAAFFKKGKKEEKAEIHFTDDEEAATETEKEEN
jgi:hypothetical protein